MLFFRFIIPVTVQLASKQVEMRMHPVMNTLFAQHAGNGNREALLAEVPHLLKSIQVPDQEGPQLRAYRLCRVDFSADQRMLSNMRKWLSTRFGIFSREQDFRILGGVTMMMMMMMMMMMRTTTTTTTMMMMMMMMTMMMMTMMMMMLMMMTMMVMMMVTAMMMMMLVMMMMVMMMMIMVMTMILMMRMSEGDGDHGDDDDDDDDDDD